MGDPVPNAFGMRDDALFGKPQTGGCSSRGVEKYDGTHLYPGQPTERLNTEQLIKPKSKPIRFIGFYYIARLLFIKPDTFRVAMTLSIKFFTAEAAAPGHP